MAKDSASPVSKPLKNVGGRPSSKSTIEELLRNGDIERWCRAGATDKQLAENIGVNLSTFYKYKAEFVEFSNTIKRARKPIITEAFEGLVRLSKGFEHTTTKQLKKEVLDRNGNIITLHEAIQETEYYPPQHQACTKVIVNYLNQLKKGGGVPEEYINEPLPEAPESKAKRLEEMDLALKELFFGEEK